MMFLAGTLGLLLAASSTSGLRALVLEGGELHPSLVTRQMDDGAVRHVPGSLVRENPQLSTDAGFIDAIARSGSQGKLGGDGIRSALHASYAGESDLGFYGLEAASAADANRLEDALVEIWSHNARMNLARVHRGGLVVVVVWTDGVSPEVWEAVNTRVAERLFAP